MAVTTIVVNVVIAIVCAVVSSYLSMKNLPNASPSSGSVPEAKDGTVIRKIYGTVWVDDSQVLAWKDLPPEPIKKKAGKK
jgi:hypothetical protein